VLTCKSGQGIRRREVETIVPQDVAEALLEAAGSRIIEKTRWRLGRWELDRFAGALSGLTLLEIELDAVDEAVPAAPHGVLVLREVTDDNRFTNNHLASLTKAEQERIVTAVYREVEG
jgi:adenylate cyclase